jgi:hypothetical protein
MQAVDERPYGPSIAEHYKLRRFQKKQSRVDGEHWMMHQASCLKMPSAEVYSYDHVFYHLRNLMTRSKARFSIIAVPCICYWF